MRSIVGSMVRSMVGRAFVLGGIARKMCLTYPDLGPSRSVKQPDTKFTLRRGVFLVTGLLEAPGAVSNGPVGGGQARSLRQFNTEWAQELSCPFHLPFAPPLMRIATAQRARAPPVLVHSSWDCAGDLTSTFEMLAEEYCPENGMKRARGREC